MMKKSRYNYFVENDGKTIWFNSISGRVFSTIPEESVFLKNVLDNPSDGGNNPRLIEWFRDNKFLVDNDTDEAQDFLQSNRESVFSKEYHLILNPTQECNFHCWYCYEQHPNGHMSPETVGRIKKLVARLIGKGITGLTISWFGGEPLLYFDEIMYPLSLYIKQQMFEQGLTFKQGITTNGYNITKQRIEQFDEIGLRHFQITLDGDRETHNKTRNQNGKPSFDVIMGNIIDICSYMPSALIKIRINYTDEIIEKNYAVILKDIPENIRKQIAVSFHRVWQTARLSMTCNDHLQRNISELNEQGFFAMPHHVFSVNRTHVCYADRYNYAHINYDGRVYKCTAQDYSDETALGVLSEDGDIEWKPGILDKMYSKANFENEKCMKCKNLPLCGGPCFKRVLECKDGKTDRFCPAANREIGSDTYIKEYYKNFRKKFESQHLNK